MTTFEKHKYLYDKNIFYQFGLTPTYGEEIESLYFKTSGAIGEFFSVNDDQKYTNEDILLINLLYKIVKNDN